MKMGQWFKSHVNSKIGEMMTKLRRTHELEDDKHKLYKSKRLDLARINGKHECAYKKIAQVWPYVGLMNPGTMFKVKCERSFASRNPTF